MPRIFDNIELSFLPTLQETLRTGDRGDFCVGYFNLRGWQTIADYVDAWDGGADNRCRLLVGMQSAPREELKKFLSLSPRGELDQATVIRLKKQIAKEFREQLAYGAPTASDEKALRQLSRQLKEKKVVVKLFLKHQLHAKLYLVHRRDHNNPTTAFLGSSNLTFAGLAYQGELNVDVIEHDACAKLQDWFEERWADRWCLDISDELVEILDASWAREDLIPPYHIYLKIAYHLSQEARAGLAEFRVPRDFKDVLFDYQSAAVKIAAHHLKKRGGVLIGDVVGLGKTVMATALAKLVEEDSGHSTLIICPKNLVKMWDYYKEQYGLRARIIPLSKVAKELPEVPARYRTVLIDESHNLRNREGKRYRVIQDYIRSTMSRCILLSATPYNKSYQDLSAQLRLFVAEDKDIGVRPENLLQAMSEVAFNAQYQCSPRSLLAFEKSPYPDDWRELMRLYLIRRTRSFIQNNYAETDAAHGDGRKFLLFPNGERFYFPLRMPKTVPYLFDETDETDPYARLTSAEVVTTIEELKLPRYGLGNYVAKAAGKSASADERKRLDGLSRAGKRLMGFSRTNLFKRLESGGESFLLSIERHILRNYIFLHAIENRLPLPIGTQSADYLDTARTDDDENELSLDFDGTEEATEAAEISGGSGDDGGDGGGAALKPPQTGHTTADYRRRAAEVYRSYENEFQKRFRWIRPSLFAPRLAEHLERDAENLRRLLTAGGSWDVRRDRKFAALLNLLTVAHPADKVLVFTQFADTADFLERELKKAGIARVAGATGNSADPTALAWRFSPQSNRKAVAPEEELRVLVATDILSEGQNLQDAHIVVNYDLPWAIIRLIQRAGRVDRIGQQSRRILCYSFMPSDGVERIIRLRERVLARLRENAEVVGTDEAFFEDEASGATLFDLYHEKSGILDDEPDSEVDLSSQAFQIWKNAVDQNPALEKTIRDLPSVGYSTRRFVPRAGLPQGVLVYVRTAENTDALAWIDEHGKSITQSQQTILQMAQCHPDTPAIPRHARHHALVEKAVETIVQEEKTVGGQLGRTSGARYRAYHRLKSYIDETRGTLFETLPESKELARAVDDVYQYPLRQTAVDLLNKRLREGIGDYQLAELVMTLRDQDLLSLRGDDEHEAQEPHIICSLGLFEAG